jgi:ABC-2 type transport system ATP-binding protein
MQRKFFQLIKEENQGGVTVFFSSHILGEVQRLCNRVAIIKEGQIIEDADIRTLQRNNYKKIKVIASDLDASFFEVSGVTNLEHHNDVHRFLLGDINTMMRKISETSVTDVTIEEPTLEEIFMHYYE